MRKTETTQSGRLGKWRLLGESVRGSSHEKRGLPCQDYHDWAILPGDVLIISIADGAGSAARAETGSLIAARTAVDLIMDESGMPGPADNGAVWTEYLKNTFQQARERLRVYSEVHKLSLSDLATTLITVVATPEICAVAQLGDGIAVARDSEGTLFPLSVPQRGEYVNEANFLTSPDAIDKTEVFLHRKPVTHIAALSDGLQRISLQMPGCEPFPGFFTPLFSFVSAIDDGEEEAGELAALLNSPKIRDRADDDLTLVLASRD